MSQFPENEGDILIKIKRINHYALETAMIDCTSKSRNAFVRKVRMDVNGSTKVENAKQKRH